MRFRFIEDRRADYPVTVICDVLAVSPAGYYAWRSRPESRRSAANRELVEDIRRVHRDTCGRYGSPRIHAELRAQGRGAIMARPRRVRTTGSRHGLPIAPNLVDRNFTAAAPNHGPRQPQDRRLGDGRSFARRPAIGSIEDGHLGAAARRRPNPPFRPRRAIRL
jgi:transposase InsO family protein